VDVQLAGERDPRDRQYGGPGFGDGRWRGDPLSPCVIFGWGPFLRLGIAGGAFAVLMYYAAGTGALWVYLRSSRSVVQPSLGRVQWRWALWQPAGKPTDVAPPWANRIDKQVIMGQPRPSPSTTASLVAAVPKGFVMTEAYVMDEHHRFATLYIDSLVHASTTVKSGLRVKRGRETGAA
jgi:hypothetical protein